jgi:hypothetical protein
VPRPWGGGGISLTIQLLTCSSAVLAASADDGTRDANVFVIREAHAPMTAKCLSPCPRQKGSTSLRDYPPTVPPLTSALRSPGAGGGCVGRRSGPCPQTLKGTPSLPKDDTRCKRPSPTHRTSAGWGSRARTQGVKEIMAWSPAAGRLLAQPASVTATLSMARDAPAPPLTRVPTVWPGTLGHKSAWASGREQDRSGPTHCQCPHRRNGCQSMQTSIAPLLIDPQPLLPHARGQRARKLLVSTHTDLLALHSDDRCPLSALGQHSGRERRPPRRLSFSPRERGVFLEMRNQRRSPYCDVHTCRKGRASWAWLVEVCWGQKPAPGDGFPRAIHVFRAMRTGQLGIRLIS